jgi:hypothetical protein
MHDRTHPVFPVAPKESIGPSLSIRDRLPWRPIAAAAAALCLVGAGIGGYLIGNSPEVDLDAVRSAAAAEGQEAGAASGREAGFEQGFSAAQKKEFAAAQVQAYREAYAAEFEAAGLTPPERIPVPGLR